MINLRFHIVSIVAVFLALAIGLFTGSTLLDRATVEVLQGRQRSLDRRNAELRTENDALRAALERAAVADGSLEADVLPVLLPGAIDDRPVLVIAGRGIDEDSVRAVQRAVGAAGASPLGIVWIDDRLDLDDTARRSAAAAAVGLDGGGVSKQEVVARIADGVAAAAGAVESPATTPDTTTPDTTAPGETAPGDTAPGENAPGDTAPTTTVADPAETDGDLDVFSRLVDADLADWESATEGEPGARVLPSGGLDVIVLSGEGVELRSSRFLTPLVRAIADRLTGLVVGEVRRSRSAVDALADDVPARGVFVDQFRTDEVLSTRVVTVDDVDTVDGRLSIVLALGQLPDVVAGAYGEAESAASPFPTVPTG